MGRMAMKEQDLLELYQLLVMYRNTYHGGDEQPLDNLLHMVSSHYWERTGGKEIRRAGNPRKAGRKRTYPESHDREILRLIGDGLSIRCTAAEAGCSPGHVQDVIKRLKNSKQ